MSHVSTAPPQRAMTVARLRSRLAALPGDLMVVLSHDAEGNHYSPLTNRGVAAGLYHTGSVYPTHEELAEDSEARELVYPDGIPEGAAPAVVLYPQR
ncbi:hypothetical protein [Streptomyces specialis]|uniref:hypothetical protein n=1 Tax=Streptomyces specialis TaxID=498367 RepID=UPI00073F869E|nr:hypothetical protein [Streptomyces specialis]